MPFLWFLCLHSCLEEGVHFLLGPITHCFGRSEAFQTSWFLRSAQNPERKSQGLAGKNEESVAPYNPAFQLPVLRKVPKSLLARAVTSWSIRVLFAAESWFMRVTVPDGELVSEAPADQALLPGFQRWYVSDTCQHSKQWAFSRLFPDYKVFTHFSYNTYWKSGFVFVFKEEEIQKGIICICHDAWHLVDLLRNLSDVLVAVS